VYRGLAKAPPRTPPPYDKAVPSPLPAVDALVREAACDAPHALCVREARATLAERRARGEHGTAADLAPELRRRVRAALEPSLRPVLNATGVVLHTNLGRAPLAGSALAHVQAVAAGYSNLELDLATGARGSRQDHVAALLCELTGAEAALCVNNGAAALVLVLAALAGGREIVVSRGQLVEIGDGFRIPEIVESAGAHLREVGTTNRTRPADYTNAFGPQTGAVLCVHPSNYRVLGFTGGVEVRALAEIAHGAALPLIYDIGSGALLDEPALAGEPLARDALREGADIVCFSGDKLLGGPQAGILAGGADAIAACRRHPLSRALRIDKLSLAALEATLRLYRDPARARAELPVLRALAEPAGAVRARAEALAARIGGTVVETVARVGGGALPLAELPSFGVRLEGDADLLAVRLRAGDPAVLARVTDGALVLDCRTLGDADAARIAAPA
jgi:L-seryl-tRNA(Ser) seleniumtransferase